MAIFFTLIVLAFFLILFLLFCFQNLQYWSFLEVLVIKGRVYVIDTGGGHLAHIFEKSNGGSKLGISLLPPSLFSIHASLRSNEERPERSKNTLTVSGIGRFLFLSAQYLD